MPGRDGWGHDKRGGGENVADLRRVVKGPDGSRYEIVGVAKDWKLGTGSVLLDAAAFLWAVVRQARGKEWVVDSRRELNRAVCQMARRVRDLHDSQV